MALVLFKRVAPVHARGDPLFLADVIVMFECRGDPFWLADALLGRNVFQQKVLVTCGRVAPTQLAIRYPFCGPVI